MTINRLYTKFLLSFIAVLVIAEVLVLVLFVIVPMRHFGNRLDDLAKSKARVVKEIVEERIGSEPGADWSQNRPLKDFIADFAKIMGGKVWLTRADGGVAVKSFPGAVPDLSGEAEERPAQGRGFRVFFRNHFGYYHAAVPIEVGQRRVGDIHVLLETHPFPFPERKGYFALGFVILGFAIALSIIPVSGLMTRRLRMLTRSAVRITEGDLSHRAHMRGNDEISELARAFNGMTDRLESMIVSGRELTANVSHELRSPLTRIRLAEEMLREKLPQAETGGWQGCLDAIREEVEDLDALIGRMLQLSRLNMQEGPLRFDSFDPSEMVRSLLERLFPHAERKGLHIETTTRYEPPFSGDRESLRSAFMNVLENAVKFTPPGGEIAIHMDWQPRSMELRVTNTSDRLSAEELMRIFDPFHRVRRSAESGYGLGLTIARKIVERHGGTITARNAEKGLEVMISLPRGEGR